MVDFKKLKAEREAAKSKKVVISASILGPRGAGKSTVACTFGKDVRVLHLVYLREAHGAVSARGITEAKEYTDLIIDDLAKEATPKCLYDTTLEALTSESLSKEFDAVVLDGLSVLDTIIQNHPDVLKANGYEKPGTVDRLYGPIVDAITRLNTQGVHTVVTCSTETREVNGVTKAIPAVRGRSGVDMMIGASSEILALDRVEIEVEENGKSVTKSAVVFDFEANVEKTGTKITKEKVISSHRPRITGVKIQDTPRYMKADMQRLLEFKQGKK